MKKRILAILSGLITAWLIIGIGEFINQQIFSPANGLDLSNPQTLADFIQTLPLSAFLSLLIIWSISAFSGGFVCTKVDKVNWQKNVLLCAGILLIGHVSNAIFIPQPLWLSAITILLIVPLTYLGGKQVN